MNSAKNIQYFIRYEYHAIGDPNPVLIDFDPVTFSGDIQTFHLSDDYITQWFVSTWKRYFELTAMPVLKEYERHRGEWQTRIIIERER